MAEKLFGEKQGVGLAVLNELESASSWSIQPMSLRFFAFTDWSRGRRTVIVTNGFVF
ncbi:hypothetical protein [Paenibacillus sophorae]|nr:hypothetical protein [Paenibacillus sophorae]QWU15523.1 hypothetical protein KP014_27350 [Paenibacillus sophorae]